MSRVLQFIKNEIVFCIALLCAAISAFFVPPSAEYISYIDWNTLFILFALMGVVAALRAHGLFDKLGAIVCTRFRTTRSLCAVLVALCFFTSMLITNDVALLTFVPFTLALMGGTASPGAVMYTVILQTIAANTGSMLTPLGNPQNLFLFEQTGMDVGNFLAVMLPYTALSAVILCISILFVKPAKLTIATADDRQEKQSTAKIIIYILLFILCILSVVRIVPKYIAAIAVLFALAILDRKLLLSIDYMLLLTFCAFFVFTGNIASIEPVRNVLEKAVQGNEYLVAAASSQVISNVPATLLLYPFAENVKNLLVGVNVGGLGTLVASLASLISFKLYAQGTKKTAGLPSQGRYLAVFTLCNVILLAVLSLLHIIL